MNILKNNYTKNLIEAGCDEVGVGCLAGPIVAAAVILPKNFEHSKINDSKCLKASQRFLLADEIKAMSFAILSVLLSALKSIAV